MLRAQSMLWHFVRHSVFYQYNMSIQLRKSYISGFKHVGSFQKPGRVLCWR